jgi:hypothetical protein
MLPSRESSRYEYPNTKRLSDLVFGRSQSQVFPRSSIPNRSWRSNLPRYRTKRLLQDVNPSTVSRQIIENCSSRFPILIVFRVDQCVFHQAFAAMTNCMIAAAISKALKVNMKPKYIAFARVSLAFSVIDAASCTVSSGRSIRPCCISFCVAARLLSWVFSWSPTASRDDADAILSGLFSCLMIVSGRACASLGAFLALSSFDSRAFDIVFWWDDGRSWICCVVWQWKPLEKLAEAGPYRMV